MDYTIGIDLGTTNSVIAALENDSPVIIANKLGERITPSVVSLTKNGEILVGRSAKNQAIINNENTVMSIKRKMGSDEKINFGNRQYTPQEISAYILSKIKKDAEEFLGANIKDAVITVPAYFDDNQRQATKDAGIIAGLNVLRIINEPTAAALAYGIDKKEECITLVYDLGGGTFDVSILDIADGVFQVLSTCGNNRLGGDDFDNELIKLIFLQFKEKEGVDLSEDKMAYQKLREEVEKAKIALSELNEVEINVPFISADENGPKHLNATVKKNQFEDLIAEFIDETIDLTNDALEDAGLKPEDIDKVIMVGGSTRIPYVSKRVFELLGKEPEKYINPDEVVALGAAIQAGIVKGETTGIVLVDVTPLALGIEIEGNVFVPVIEKNATIPCSAKRIFTTISDNQSVVEIHVMQGERSRADENISLGKFQLSGIRKAGRGEPRVEVEFRIDVDGIVHVSAVDLDTNASQEIHIENPSNLSDEEIQSIISEAEEKRHEDKIYLETLKKQKILETELSKLSEKILLHEKDITEKLKNELMDFLSGLDNKIIDFKLERLNETLETVMFYNNEMRSELEKLESNQDVKS